MGFRNGGETSEISAFEVEKKIKELECGNLSFSVEKLSNHVH